MKVENRKCIRRLAFRSLKANRRRNLIATTAIVLTAVLFTTMFTILMSISATYENSIMRELGGYEQASFKSVTEQDIETLSSDRRIKEWGVRTVIGVNDSAAFKKHTAEIISIYSAVDRKIAAAAQKSAEEARAKAEADAKSFMETA